MIETKIDKAYVENRVVSVPNIHSEHCEEILHEYLDEIPGMLDIVVDHNRMSVRLVYDSSQVGFDKIEMMLATAGYPLSNSHWSRIKSTMYRFMDKNSRSNAHSTASACCSHPKGIYTKGRKR